MNPNKTECILFGTTKFKKRTETIQLTNDSVEKHMEDKVKKLGVKFDSRQSFDCLIKLLGSRLNLTLSSLNRVKNTINKISRILFIYAILINALNKFPINLNYCSSIWGK